MIDSPARPDTTGTRAATYTANALNQYTQRSVPGVFDVAGAAGSGATVTVNSQGTTRHGEYFFKGQGMANNPNPVYSTLAVSDGTTTTNLAAFLAGTPEPFTYDFDGNLTSDGRWDYVYDAENRLVSMQTHTALSPTPLANADARRLEFKNDYLGRRVQKTVRDGWNGSTYTTVISDEKFVYDGWNTIARLNASSLSLTASYYWGLDLSGTLQGAGGVGGLLLVQEGGNSYLPAYDALGNLHAMIKAADGSLAAAYEYDAFGQTLRESGPYAASNSFRFATKYADVETGLVQYNTRYYSPGLGRFINRDSIGEQGGLNLYAYVGNNGVNHWDYLGQVDDYTRTRADGSTYYDYGGYVYGTDFVSYGNAGVATRGGTSYGSGVTLNPAGPADYRVTFPDGSSTIVTARSDAEAEAIATRKAGSQPAPNNPAGTVVTVDGRTVTPSVRLGETQYLGVVDNNGLTPVAPYEPWDGTMTYQTPFPSTYQSPHVANSNDLFMATADSFSRSGLDGAPRALLVGGLEITAGVAGGFAVAAAYPVVAGGVEAFSALPPQAKAFIIGGAIRLTFGAGGEHTATNLAARRVLANTIAAEVAAAAAKPTVTGPHP